MTAFLTALSEGFCPECLVPLESVEGSDMPHCPHCHGWWSRQPGLVHRAPDHRRR